MLCSCQIFISDSFSLLKLLDCFVIPVLMILSWWFLKTRYRIVHYVAVCVCLLGVGAMVGADLLTQREQGSSKWHCMIHSFICSFFSLPACYPARGRGFQLESVQVVFGCWHTRHFAIVMLITTQKVPYDSWHGSENRVLVVGMRGATSHVNDPFMDSMYVDNLIDQESDKFNKLCCVLIRIAS